RVQVQHPRLEGELAIGRGAQVAFELQAGVETRDGQRARRRPILAGLGVIQLVLRRPVRDAGSYEVPRATEGQRRFRHGIEAPAGNTPGNEAWERCTVGNVTDIAIEVRDLGIEAVV